MLAISLKMKKKKNTEWQSLKFSPDPFLAVRAKAPVKSQWINGRVTAHYMRLLFGRGFRDEHPFVGEPRMWRPEFCGTDSANLRKATCNKPLASDSVWTSWQQ